ncbi:hypothetical protein D0Z07_4292 [Hyphodiscus hymeniophilus]|uniref:SMP-30/Gluconolactonase/LRE-like region domain-containing protein n=1 Tax=Hyphodiscus hymeniophilus TaxID=353542 RepID=A0A9P6VKX6_9HELO|nr:hypothetical protein D0Z07_4292 [Hyphodiscus hymeniophilus]
MFTLKSFLYAAFAAECLFLDAAKALPSTVAPPSSNSIQTLWQFPNNTWAENLAVRSNGDLLVTLLSAPQVYQVNPRQPKTPALVHTFPNATGALGIVEYEQDVFAVVVGNWTIATFLTVNGSYSVWKVDMRGFKSDSNGHVTKPAVVSKITDIPEADFLNGITLINEGSRDALIADSVLGVVWKLNLDTAEYSIVLDSPLMKVVPGQIQLGINGVHTRDGFLYFTNSFQGLFAKVAIDLCGNAIGPYTLIAETGVSDDFAFDKSGNAYIAQDPSDALERVTPAGKVNVLVGNVNNTIVEGATAAQFGILPFDESILYVTTNGGLAGRVPGTDVVGGKILAINLPNLLKSDGIH